MLAEALKRTDDRPLDFNCTGPNGMTLLMAIANMWACGTSDNEFLRAHTLEINQQVALILPHLPSYNITLKDVYKCNINCIRSPRTKLFR